MLLSTTGYGPFLPFLLFIHVIAATNQGFYIPCSSGAHNPPSVTKHLAQVFITTNTHSDVAFRTEFPTGESVFHTEPDAILQTHLYGPINIQEGCRVPGAW